MRSVPLVSIIMPTYNSARTIRLALESIAAQQIDPSAYEVLVVDGGSFDGTQEIAQQYGCKVLANPAVQPEHAKLVGLKSARGKYCMFLDSDEVLSSSEALPRKIALLDGHPEVKNIATAGLKNPIGYPSLNDYTNRFGDPFSYYMYRLDGGDYAKSLRQRYHVEYEDDHALIVKFQDGDILPICDGGAHFFDVDFLRSMHAIDSPTLVPLIFHEMGTATQRLAVIKGDFVLHYSTTSFTQLLKKIKWRVVNNVHRAAGTEGFSNRQSHSPLSFRLRKYLFIPYSLAAIGPLITAATMSARYRNASFMAHAPLSIYTAITIVFEYVRKLAGGAPQPKIYGQ